MHTTPLCAIQGVLTQDSGQCVWVDSAVCLASVVCLGVQSLDSSVVCLTSTHLQVCKDNGNQGAATCSSVLPPHIKLTTGPYLKHAHVFTAHV